MAEQQNNWLKFFGVLLLNLYPGVWELVTMATVMM